MIFFDEALSTHLMALGVMLSAEALKIQLAVIYQLSAAITYWCKVINVTVRFAADDTLTVT